MAEEKQYKVEHYYEDTNTDGQKYLDVLRAEGFECISFAGSFVRKTEIKPEDRERKARALEAYREAERILKEARANYEACY